MIRCFLLAVAAASLFLEGAVLGQQPGTPPTPTAGARPSPPGSASALFSANCASCHGSDLGGGRGPSLFADALLSARSDEVLRQTVRDGMPEGGMPSFKDLLTDEQISQVIAYLRIEGGRLKGQPSYLPDPNNLVVRSQKQAFRVEVVASGLETPWGEVFLPDGRMLVTERTGHIRIIDHGKLLPDPVKGTPRPWVHSDAGFLDIALHPDYSRNGWIYLAYSELVPGYDGPPPPGLDAPRTSQFPPSMTRIIRGRINAGNEWVDEQELFRAPASLYTTTNIHYGSRFLFDGKGHVFWTMGERGNMANAQSLSSPLGKIHRINDDGSVPSDNPFVGTPGADPTVWSYGHRNPEGLSYDPVTGLLWETEHGPTGGDEINIIEKGHDYGWGVVSMGLQPGITHQHQAGMDDPITYYSPSIAPSGITFYKGDRYPGWKNDLFVAALAGQKLLRIEVEGRKIISQEAVFQGYGRVRDVITGPDGLLYVLLQNSQALANSPGMVIRLVPLKN